MENEFSTFADIYKETGMKKTNNITRRVLAVILSLAMMFSTMVFTSFAADGDEPHVHSYDDGVVTVEPGCLSPGVKTFTCSGCPEGTDGHSYTEEIPAAGHKFAKVGESVAPTCTQRGYDNEVCTVCKAARQANFVAANGHSYETERVAVSCTGDGGTLYTCSICAAKPESEREMKWQYLESDETALGHDMGEYKIVKYHDDETGVDAYAKQAECQREGCDYKAYELGADESVNIYYCVQYVNDYANGTKVTMSDGSVLDAEPYNNPAFLQTDFVLAGTKAPAFKGDTPTRGATEEYGKYTFTGWTTDDGDLEAVNGNLIVHANFVGEAVTHFVVFYNPDGSQIGQAYHVGHGEGLAYPAENPTYVKHPDNFHYEFDHWNTDLSAVYSDRSVHAVYNPVGKTYKIIYCDYNGSQLASEVFQYGEAPKNNPTNIYRPEDETYIYEFSGKWTYKYEAPSGETTAMFSEDYLVDTLRTPSKVRCLDCNRGYDYFEYDPANENDQYMTDVEKGIIRVYADYYTRAKIYKLRVMAVDSEYYPIYNAGTIQVLNPDGSLRKTATLGDDATAVLELTYEKYYTIQVTYMGEVAQETITLDERNRSDNFPTLRLVLGSPAAIQEDHADHCTCISHTPFIGRIYIAFLNVIYRLTGRKIVCCFDMYERHADQLVYTA